jgi:hypothetical protein
MSIFILKILMHEPAGLISVLYCLLAASYRQSCFLRNQVYVYVLNLGVSWLALQ